MFGHLVFSSTFCCLEGKCIVAYFKRFAEILGGVNLSFESHDGDPSVFHDFTMEFIFQSKRLTWIEAHPEMDIEEITSIDDGLCVTSSEDGKWR